MNSAIVGAGYVGTVTEIGFTETGWGVYGIDTHRKLWRSPKKEVIKKVVGEWDEGGFTYHCIGK